MNKKYLLGIPVVALLIACGSGGTDATSDDIARLNEQANGNPSVASTPKVKVTNITDGDWEVGAKDNFAAGIISPGTYVVTSPADNSSGCLWMTVKDFTGESGSIINVGTVNPGKSGRMVVKKSYGGVSLDGDCLAKKKG